MIISPYLTHLLILVGMYIILGSSLNLAMGYTGLLNLGHVAFFGIGAYTSALLTLQGVPFVIAIMTAGLVASLFGFILSFATRNLKGDYLALATLGFSFVAYSVFLNWTGLTRGPLGIPGIPKPSFGNFVVATNQGYLVLVAAIAVITLLVLWRITSSRYGKVLEAVRDDALAAAVLGKPVFKLKSQSLAISAFFAGIAGSLFAHYLTYIDPSSFFISEIILVITIVMVGGLASLRGSLLAAAIIILIPEMLRLVYLPSSIIGPMRQILYAVILIAVIMFRPRGLLGRVDLE